MIKSSRSKIYIAAVIVICCIILQLLYMTTHSNSVHEWGHGSFAQDQEYLPDKQIGEHSEQDTAPLEEFDLADDPDQQGCTAHGMNDFDWKQYFVDGETPLKIYVYDDPILYDETADYPPHFEIDLAFREQILKSNMTVNNIEEADVAFVPIALASFFFRYADVSRLCPGCSPEERVIAVDSRLRETWVEFERKWTTTWAPLLADQEVRSRVPHFVLWSYVFYRAHFDFIPRDIKILAYENYGVTGEPEDLSYDNGCYDRCVVIPYPTYHSWSKVEDTNRVSYFGGLQEDKISLDEYYDRRLVTFIGSVERTTTLQRFRKKVIDQFVEYSGGDPKIFAQFSGTIMGIDNSHRYRESQFCIALPGDTPTRNGFYESMVEGCTPIVYESTMQVYGELFGGCLPMSKMVLTIPDNIWNDEGDPRQVLDAIEKAHGKEETLERVKALQKHRFFWNYHTKVLHGVSVPVFAALKAVVGKVIRHNNEPLIYVYDLPERFNLGMMMEGIVLGAADSFKIDDTTDESIRKIAFGPELTKEIPIFSNVEGKRHLTSQYALEPLVHYQLMRHPRRTVIKSKASIAVIPAYLFFSGWSKHPNVFNTFDIAEKYADLLNTIHWEESDIPHVIFYGDVMWNVKPHFPQNDVVRIPNNTYFVTLEEHSEGYPSMGGEESGVESLFGSGTALEGKMLSKSHVVTTAFPTSVHFYNRNDNGKVYQASSWPEKSNLLCYAGRDRWPIPSLKIGVVNGAITNTDFKEMLFEQTGWKTLNDEGSTLQILELYMSCTFSLHPYADMGTRRGFYDSLTVGTIPVIFHENAPRYASIYRSLNARADIYQMAVIIGPFSHVDELIEENRGAALARAIVDALKSIPTTELEKKRKYIFENLHLFQYSRFHDDDDALNTALDTVLAIHGK